MSKQRLIINSSLPRTGSTVFQHIMAQNPTFYTTPTNTLVDLVRGAQQGFAEYNVLPHPDREHEQIEALFEFCRGGIESYMASISNKPNFLDKGRPWASNYLFIKKVFPEIKMICLVRDLRAIITSMEKIFRRTPEKAYQIRAEYSFRTINNRFQYYLNEPMIMNPLLDIHNILQLGDLKNILFIKFEDLCKNPETTLKTVYSFLELEYYHHDFDNISQIYKEVDTRNFFSDHNIQKKLSIPKDDWDSILGPNISNQIYNDFKWYFDYFEYPEK